jgi:hypothetical protein
MTVSSGRPQRHPGEDVARGIAAGVGRRGALVRGLRVEVRSRPGAAHGQLPAGDLSPRTQSAVGRERHARTLLVLLTTVSWVLAESSLRRTRGPDPLRVASPVRGLTALPGSDIPPSGGVGVERTSRHRNARTWYAEASPGKQHLVMLAAASLMVLVLIAIVALVLMVFGGSAEGAL